MSLTRGTPGHRVVQTHSDGGWSSDHSARSWSWPPPVARAPPRRQPCSSNGRPACRTSAVVVSAHTGRFTGHHPGRSVRTHALPVLAGRDRQDDLHGRLRRDLAATDRLEPAGDRRERGHRISPRNHHPARRIDAGDLQRHAALSLQRGQEGRRHRRAGCGRDLVRGAGFGVGSSDSVDQHERATRVDFDHVTDLTGHHTSRRDAGTGGHRAPGYRSASHCSTGDLAPGHLAPAHLTAHHPVGRGRVRLLTEPGA